MIANQHRAGSFCADRGSRRTTLAELPCAVQIDLMNRCVSVLLTWIRLAIMVVGMVQLAAVPAALPADPTRATLHVVAQSQTALLTGARSLQVASLSAPSTAASVIPKLYGPQPDPGLSGNPIQSGSPRTVLQLLAWQRQEPLQVLQVFRVPQARAPPGVLIDVASSRA